MISGRNSTYKVIKECIFAFALFVFDLQSEEGKEGERAGDLCCYYLNKINIQFPSVPTENKFHIGPRVKKQAKRKEK
jgi:hypothetical protein